MKCRQKNLGFSEIFYVFCERVSKIYIMHAIGVYIMPPPRGGTNIPRSQNMMYRVPRHNVPTTSALCIGFADIVDGKNTVCYYKSMKKDLLSELSLELAELCVNLAKELQKKKEYNFADQIKRSATSVAANVAEAGHQGTCPTYGTHPIQVLF